MLYCEYCPGYIAFGNAFRHGYPCKQNRLRLTSAPHLHCYAIQRWVRILSYLCQKERNLNRTVFDLGFFWRRKRDSNPRGFWPNGFQARLVMPASIFLRIQMTLEFEYAENIETALKTRFQNPLRMPDKSHLGARSQGACRGTRRSLDIPTQIQSTFY